MEQWLKLAEELKPDVINTYMTAHAYVKILECKLIALSRFMTKKAEFKNEITVLQESIKKAGGQGTLFALVICANAMV